MIKKLHAFTLIEMVMVIIVISILAVGSSMLWPGASISLAAQTQQVVDDIRYTQSLAMSKGQRYYLAISSTTSYQIKNSAGTAITLPLGGTTATLSSGVTFGTLTNLPNSLIAFDGQGVPYVTSSSPGTALASTATIPLTADSETRTISIAPQTGSVSYS